MDKKILVGSIAAAVILVLISFNPVVGYRTVESSVKDSPLFSVRTKRAINEENDSLTFDYVGKENGYSIPIPIRTDWNRLSEELFDIVSTMDGKELERLKNLIFYEVADDKRIKNDNLVAIFSLVDQLEQLPASENNNIIIENHELDTHITVCAWSFCYWGPGCLIFLLLQNFLF